MKATGPEMIAPTAADLMARVIDHLTRAGMSPGQGPSGFISGCPLCRKPSITISRDEGGAVVTCRSGCVEGAILKKIGLRPEEVRILVDGGADAAKLTPSKATGAGRPASTPKRRAGRRLVVERASDIKPEAVRWLWPGRIPLGKVTVLEGHAGLGKTLVAVDIAARVSRGRPMPFLAEPPPEGPRGVLIVSYEDDPRDTIRPRLDAAEADLERVHIIKGALTAADEDCPVVLPDDLKALEDEIRKHNAALVLVDPLMAAFSQAIDAHRDQDVRRAMSPIRALAEKTGVAFLLIRHLRKASASSAVLAGQGSTGIGAAARTVYLVAKDREDPEETRILAPVKTNVARSIKALRFRLACRTIEGIESPCIEWLGECDETADELTAAPPDAEDGGAVAEAVAFLRAELAAGPKPANAVKEAADTAGVSWRSVERAKARAGVEPRKSSFGGGWEWALKDATDAKTASAEGLAALAKTANGPPTQPLDSTTKTAKPTEDRQAHSLADLGESQDLAESMEGMEP